MNTKVTPAVWDALRELVEKFPAVLSEKGAQIFAEAGSFSSVTGRHIDAAIRLGILESVRQRQPLESRRAFLWRIVPEAQVELDRFLERGAKVDKGFVPQLTLRNVRSLEALHNELLNRSVLQGGYDSLATGAIIPGWRSRRDIVRLMQFGALELAPNSRYKIWISEYGRALLLAFHSHQHVRLALLLARPPFYRKSLPTRAPQDRS